MYQHSNTEPSWPTGIAGRLFAQDTTVAAAFSHDETTARVPIVVLLVGDHAPPDIVVERALGAARALGGELHVAVALSHGTDEDDPAAVLESIVDHLIEAGIDTLDIEIHAGETGEVAAAVGAAKPIDLIVMSPDVGDGALAAEIADELKVPVLVAREPRAEGPVVAATDMTRPYFPVLAASRTLARVLHKRVTFFHNSAPSFPVKMNPIAAPVSYITSGGMADDGVLEKLERLRTLAEPGEDVVVARSHETVEAILETVRERDADLVTVGHSKHPWFVRLFGHDLAERLVDRCPRSVLIVPVEAR